jgi:UDP-glucose 4-epimerase
MARFLLAGDHAERVCIYSRGEATQALMREEFQDDRLRFFIGDVRDGNRLERAIGGHSFAGGAKTDLVIHAAALKQVPSCEFYPMEAFKTNVKGTENVINSAIANNVKKVICLSTDKAVYPINAMGLSKAMMEKLMVSKSRMRTEGETILCATRYGNVMASRGSVIPLFISQLKEGKAITITDPNMTRFLMSLEDSVDLVLHAFKNGRQGDIFIQKAPASTIEHLAIALKELFKKNNEIRIIGTRHGEKLYESLVAREELAKAEDMGNYFRVMADNRDLNYAKFFVEGETSISTLEDYTSHNTTRLDIEGVKNTLLKLEYVRNELSN